MFKKLRITLSALLLGIGLLAYLGHTSVIHAESNGGVKIMPLGDSITDGYNVPGGYRVDLWQKLAADGHTDDFVGSQFNGPATLGDHDHEGHPGWRIDQIDAHIVGWLTTYQPRTILLHIGTNDMIQNYDVANAPTRLGTLLDDIIATDPTADVFVATIIPIADQTQNARATSYNTAIPGIVNSRITAGKHVHLVAMQSALTTADLADGVHPTAGGYSKMANRWYSALIGSPVTRWEAENASISDARLINDATASGGVKTGYIDHADSSVTWTNLYAPYTGTYRMYVRFGNGMNTTCTHRLTINGGNPITLTYPSYGWDNWGNIALSVTLNRGPNTLQFAHDQCYTELDAIDFATPQSSPYI